MVAPKLNPARERHWICAQRLRERRLVLGLTQREVVARLAGTGHQTTNRTLSAMENGGRCLDLGLLPELAECLCCTVTYLLGLTDDPDDWRPGSCPSAPPVTVSTVDSGQVTAESMALAGILGPNIPAGFGAPGRARKRHGSTAGNPIDDAGKSLMA
jgi:transcriptional regulator with XRE-family HTH domain